jgi:hypothetical protein
VKKHKKTGSKTGSKYPEEEKMNSVFEVVFLDFLEAEIIQIMI